MISRSVVVIAFLGSLGAAFVTKDWECPPGRRLHVQGRRFLQQQGAGGPEAGIAPEVPQPAPTPDVTPEPAKAPDSPAPEPAPRELRSIADVELCPAENGAEPAFTRSCEIHIGPDGELSWHAGGKSTDLDSLGALTSGLKQRSEVADVVLVPDRLAPWIWVRYAIVTAQKLERGTFWIGVGSEDEPQKLRVLPLPQVGATGQTPPTENVFVVRADEADGADVYTVNGVTVESFPFDLASAWSEWKKAHPDADTSTPDVTPVLLENSRDVGCRTVVRLLDVLTKLGIQSVQLSGDLGRMPR